MHGSNEIFFLGGGGVGGVGTGRYFFGLDQNFTTRFTTLSPYLKSQKNQYLRINKPYLFLYF